MYVWETTGDERVRESHIFMDGALCRWDDSTVLSQDGGKTWIDRPISAVQLHPGMDYQCRCSALAYWQELVGEADAQIDEQFNEPNSDEQNTANKTTQSESSSDIKIDEEKVAKALNEVEMKIKDLDHEEGYVIGLDGKQIHHEVGGAHSVAPPSEKVKGNIFTHNHPSGGASFSFNDIKSIIADDGFGVRAVTSEGKFVDFRKGTGELKTNIVEDMAKARLGTSNLMIDAGARAMRRFGPKATVEQRLTIMNEIMNKWLVDNARKYGYIYTEGNL
jgi:hypothetical protein